MPPQCPSMSNCAECHKESVNRENTLICQGPCKSLFHSSCLNMPEKQCKLISDLGEVIMWTCNKRRIIIETYINTLCNKNYHNSHIEKADKNNELILEIKTKIDEVLNVANKSEATLMENSNKLIDITDKINEGNKKIVDSLENANTWKDNFQSWDAQHSYSQALKLYQGLNQNPQQNKRVLIKPTLTQPTHTTIIEIKDRRY